MDAALFPVVTEADARLPLCLTSVGHWAHQDPVRRPDGFPDYQWLQVAGGEGFIEVGGRRMTARAGQGICLFPQEPHRYEGVRGPWELYWISFSGAWSAELLGQAGVTGSGVYGIARPESAILHLRSLLESAQAALPFPGEEYSKALYAFLLDLRRLAQDGSAASEQRRSRLQPVFRLIEERLHQPLSIAEMAASIGASPQHLCTLFRRTLDMRPMAYVNRERIKRGKELMFRENGMPIREVARRVGFDSPSYFGAVFRRLEGCSPEQFKRLHGLE